jgi:hypothetical protein
MMVLSKTSVSVELIHIVPGTYIERIGAVHGLVERAEVQAEEVLV